MPEEQDIPGRPLNEELTADSIVQDSSISTIETKTPDMEVHKHPHHITHKKKWGEYLLEFLMLFLAVFLGFVAENIRENFADQSKEREYMIRMIADLKADTASISITIENYTTIS